MAEGASSSKLSTRLLWDSSARIQRNSWQTFFQSCSIFHLMFAYPLVEQNGRPSKWHQNIIKNCRPITSHLEINKQSFWRVFPLSHLFYWIFRQKKQVQVAILAPKLDFGPSSTDQIKKQCKALKLTCQ